MLRDRQRWARSKGEFCVEGSVSEVSVLSRVKNSASVCERVVENERATGKTFVRLSDCKAAMGGLEGRSVQTRRDTVSKATAITELVVVEALRISNSMCEAMGEPSLDMTGEKRSREPQGPTELRKRAKYWRNNTYQTETSRVNASLKMRVG